MLLINFVIYMYDFVLQLHSYNCVLNPFYWTQWWWCLWILIFLAILTCTQHFENVQIYGSILKSTKTTRNYGYIYHTVTTIYNSCIDLNKLIAWENLVARLMCSVDYLVRYFYFSSKTPYEHIHHISFRWIYQAFDKLLEPSWTFLLMEKFLSFPWKKLLNKNRFQIQL